MLRGYLPDLHAFDYIATAPWPRCYTASDQQDWILSVELLESWLETHVGHHWSDWAYNNASWGLQPGHCSLAFRRAPDRTLFLLCWG